MAAYFDVLGKKGIAEVVKIYDTLPYKGSDFSIPFESREDADYAKEVLWHDAIIVTHYAVRFDDGSYIRIETSDSDKSGFVIFKTRDQVEAEARKAALDRISPVDKKLLGISVE